MGFNIKVLKFLADRYVVNILFAADVAGTYMFYEKDVYDRIHGSGKMDEFLFDMLQVDVQDYVYDMYRKFYVRPSKETNKVILEYCKDKLINKYRIKMNENGIGYIIGGMINQNKSIIHWIVNRK